MGIASLNTSVTTTLGADNTITNIAEIDNLIAALKGGNFTGTHMKDGWTLPAVQSTPLVNPAVGDMRVDTSTTPATLRQYDGSDEVAVGIDYSATQPTYTVAGKLWHDPTLVMLRQYKAFGGVTGWHPVSGDYRLFQSDGTIAAGDCVRVNNATGKVVQTATNQTANANPRDVEVVGVALEAATAATFLVVALASGSAEVLVNVDESGGAAAAGDLLAAGAGDAIPVDDIYNGGPLNSQSSFVLTQHGYPLGAFAQALALSSGGQVRCRMLGQVGHGRYVQLDTATQIAATLTQDDAPHEIDITSSLVNARHVPYAVKLRVRAKLTAASASVDLEFHRLSDVNATHGTTHDIRYTLEGAAGSSTWTRFIEVNVITNPSSDAPGPENAGPGTFITYSADSGGGVTTLALDLVGYWI